MEKESESGRIRVWRRLEDRARKDRYFLGWALGEYEKLCGFDGKQLANWLGCSQQALQRLALCRLPDDKKARFHGDVRQIAEFASCDADRLMQLLRQVAAFSSLRGEKEDARSDFLLAARDRRPHDGEDEN